MKRTIYLALLMAFSYLINACKRKPEQAGTPGKEYTIIPARTLEILEAEVTRKLDIGFKPTGGLVVYTAANQVTYYYQAMYKDL